MRGHGAYIGTPPFPINGPGLRPTARPQGAPNKTDAPWERRHLLYLWKAGGLWR